MNERIIHRGPDHSGIWTNINKNIFLGHQRLSIIDLSDKGNQPMISSSGNVAVYNGEIYNFRELRAELKEYKFFSETDTEVILCLYEKYGYRLLEKLNGMFAFAIWNDEKKELFLARDRIGIKPLYYVNQNGIFAFSSEIKALFALPWIKAEIDEFSLYHFLTFNKLSAPNTMFKNVHKFYPGFKMIVNERGIHSYEPYWEISFSDYDNLSEEDIKRVLLEKFEMSIRSQLISDVPVGTFLSGGVDSSAVVAFMNKNSSMPINTFSIGFANCPDYDELKYARKVSKLFGTNHAEVVVKPKDIVDFLPKVVEIFDEPLADATSIPIYFLSKLARENGAYVILTGDGGDELFCGYNHWINYMRIYPCYSLILSYPQIFRDGLFNILKPFFNATSPLYDIVYRMKKGQDLFWAGAGGFKEGTKRLFLRREYINKIKDLDSYSEVLYYRNLFKLAKTGYRKWTYVDWLCYYGIKSEIPNHYLYRADRLGMANSVELRVPFLDHNFVNFALSIPAKWKVYRNTPKYIFKRSLEKTLPKTLLYRKKRGFCVPLREWAFHLLQSFVELNLKDFCRETEFFDEKALKNLINKTYKGSCGNMFMLWNVYFLILWFKKWILN